MSIFGEPKFSDVPPLRRHFIYGVNCYQYAIGKGHEVTVFTKDRTKQEFNYLTLCPGHMAEAALSGGQSYISAYELKRLIIQGCREDKLVELEQRSLHAAIHVPDNMRLIAFYFTDNTDRGMGDFDFMVYNPKTSKWENKTPLSDTDFIDNLLPSHGNHYIFQRFFVAPDNVAPCGIPQGMPAKLSNDLSLNIVTDKPYWARGPVLEDRGDQGLFFRRLHPHYAKPAWPQMATTPA